jgi:hypothetical protein
MFQSSFHRSNLVLAGPNGGAVTSELVSSSWTSTTLVSVSEDEWLSLTFSILTENGFREAEEESGNARWQEKLGSLTALINIRSLGCLDYTPGLSRHPAY